jgi:RNA recognition motif-containing protein
MNIYVGNLSWTITDADLMSMFMPFGEVSAAKIVTDKLNNNRSKGFGFVEMPNDEEAKNAIANLYDTEIQGRKIIVNESQPREQSGGGGAGGYRKRGGYGGGS